MAQVVDHVFFTGHITAYRGDGFAERAHLDIDGANHVEVFFDTATGFAEHAHGVGLIHHQPSIVFLAKLDHIGQVDDVAVHAEDGIRDDELRNIGGGLLETLFKVCHVVMFETAEKRARHHTTIHNAGVVELVREHPVATPHQGRDDGEIGGITRRVSNSGFGMFEIGDGFFEFVVQVERSGQGAHAVGAGAIFIDGGFGSGGNSGMTEQAQISV